MKLDRLSKIDAVTDLKRTICSMTDEQYESYVKRIKIELIVNSRSDMIEDSVNIIESLRKKFKNVGSEDFYIGIDEAGRLILFEDKENNL